MPIFIKLFEDSMACHPIFRATDWHNLERSPPRLLEHLEKVAEQPLIFGTATNA
jgi:hypothetical protein